ncbi:E3 ubiquitin-protein ligase parkin isoform X2 [Arctopsyche grandis]|uniref:E3 ubiquitin-protein ligase parkin isoform X2 n=1 Tax=Arctopsyche grandis TaxID=121162 RepID=UPI00406D9976
MYKNKFQYIYILRWVISLDVICKCAIINLSLLLLIINIQRIINRHVDCDLGPQTILHAVKLKKNENQSPTVQEDDEGSKPLSETLLDLQLNDEERRNLPDSEKAKVKAHFYVSCNTCNKMQEGKLRVRCKTCKIGAFTVHADPQSWQDVLEPNQITGECLNEPSCSVIHHNIGPTYAEFYFKCTKHVSEGEKDSSVPLYLIKANIKDIPCLACSDVSETVLVFPCDCGHVTCLECFRHYCTSRLSSREFLFHPQFGYTLSCPAGCENSFIKETHHFKLLTDNQYKQYQRFAAEEYVLQSGGVLCPQPGCGSGILIDPHCTKITCIHGCGYVFCIKCRQGYHIGECSDTLDNGDCGGPSNYNIDPSKAIEACWDLASKTTIRIISKPCPKCRTPTERDGGCMHIVCVRSGCSFEWCWVCQTQWTRECMGAHWFG